MSVLAIFLREITLYAIDIDKKKNIFKQLELVGWSWPFGAQNLTCYALLGSTKLS